MIPTAVPSSTIKNLCKALVEMSLQCTAVQTITASDCDCVTPAWEERKSCSKISEGVVVVVVVGGRAAASSCRTKLYTSFHFSLFLDAFNTEALCKSHFLHYSGS